MSEQKYLYVVFSSTPYKIGKFIRAATHYPYNHVAIALDEDLRVLYSFARHYKNTPFYGGFVKESRLRYLNNGKYAKVKVYAIPVTDQQLTTAKSYLHSVETNADKYVYNMFSAACSLFKKRVRLCYAFTCVEFAADLLSECGITEGLNASRFCSIEALDASLSGYSADNYPVSEAIPNSSWDEDTFPERKSFWSRTRLTVKTNGRLIYYFIKSFPHKKRA